MLTSFAGNLFECFAEMASPSFSLPAKDPDIVDDVLDYCSGHKITLGGVLIKEDIDNDNNTT